MTTPVVVKRPKEQGFRMNDYTVSFLLPADYQKNAPKPTDPKVGSSKTWFKKLEKVTLSLKLFAMIIFKFVICSLVVR